MPSKYRGPLLGVFFYLVLWGTNLLIFITIGLSGTLPFPQSLTYWWISIFDGGLAAGILLSPIYLLPLLVLLLAFWPAGLVRRNLTTRGEKGYDGNK